jgi:hypothetical protein
MKTKLQFRILIAAFIGVAFSTQIMGQKLNTDRSISDINKRVVLNKVAYFQDFGTYISNHLTYPKLAQEYNVEGIVQAEIAINFTGEIISVKIISGLGFGCDEAVLNVLTNMPSWNPSLKNGTPIAQKLFVPVKFSLR